MVRKHSVEDKTKAVPLLATGGTKTNTEQVFLQGALTYLHEQMPTEGVLTC